MVFIQIDAESIIKRDNHLYGVQCPNCRLTGDFMLGRKQHRWSILFIPIAQITAAYFLECQHCRAAYYISAGQYKRIKHSNNCAYDAYNIFIELQEKAKDISAKQAERSREIFVKYAQRSNKKTGAAALLSFFFGIAGAQNWYLGHKKRAIAAIIIFVSGFALVLAGPLPFAICIAFNVYWGIIDAVRIALGFAKDSSGKYVMTDGQYDKRRRGK